MKRWLFGGAAILLLFLLSCIFLIPGKIVVIKSITAKANLNGVYRFLGDDSNWKKWLWEQSSTAESSTGAIESGGYKFIKNKLGYNSFEINIEKNKKIEPSLLRLFSMGNDSIKIEWSTILQTNSKNPFTKISHYLKARNLGSRLESALAGMQYYISQVKHIYGVDIREEKIMTEFLASRKKIFPRYPTNEDIYGMIGEIRKYIAHQQLKEEDYPIFNISPSGAADFELLVAVPVNKRLPDSRLFSSMKLLKHGNILVTEVNGDKKAMESALQQLNIYAEDHQYRNIALPYQSFITDRMTEADTSKWLTRISYPFI